MAQVWSMRKKQGDITYSMAQEIVVSEMFIISPGNWIQLERTPQSQEVDTLEYGPFNQPITWHIEAENNNNLL